MKQRSKVWFRLKICTLLFVFMAINADKKFFAQNQTGDKGFDNPAFADDKPGALGTGGAGKTKKRTKTIIATKIIVGRKKSKINRAEKQQPNYVVDEDFQETGLGNQSEYIGFTLWRVSKTNTDGSKDLEDESNYQRLEDDTRLEDGELVKLLITSSRSGYLYIINYELRTDGSFGTAKIIFPNTKYYKGNNFIKANYPFVIPPETRFRVTNRSQEAGKVKDSEVLVVIVSPTELPLPRGDDGRGVAITFQDFGRLLDSAKRLEAKARLEGGVGQKPSTKERSAFNSKDLVDETVVQDDQDPVPQSLLMGVAQKNLPIWVKIKLYAKR